MMFATVYILVNSVVDVCDGMHKIDMKNRQLPGNCVTGITFFEVFSTTDLSNDCRGGYSTFGCSG